MKSNLWKTIGICNNHRACVVHEVHEVGNIAVGHFNLDKWLLFSVHHGIGSHSGVCTRPRPFWLPHPRHNHVYLLFPYIHCLCFQCHDDDECRIMRRKIVIAMGENPTRREGHTCGSGIYSDDLSRCNWLGLSNVMARFSLL
jgi:hypothetical protein